MPLQFLVLRGGLRHQALELPAPMFHAWRPEPVRRGQCEGPSSPHFMMQVGRGALAT